MNIRELQIQFDTPEKCIAFLESKRWPKGVRCVTCGADRISRVTSSSKKQNVRRLYECLEPTCRQQFTVTSGTCMHDSHLPLQVWILAIALMMGAKKGMPALQLQRYLGLGSYKTAWHLFHRIREGMRTKTVPMLGVIEIDETYVGGKKIGQGVYKGKRSKTAVMGAIKRGGDLKLKSLGKPSVDGKDAAEFIKETVGAGTQMVCTDDSAIYPNPLRELEHRHQAVNHSAKEYVRFKHIHTNTIENAFSLFKRGVIGNYHQVSAKHMQRYLDEFEFRFNGRKDPNLFSKAVRATMLGSRLPFAKLVKN